MWFGVEFWEAFEALVSPPMDTVLITPHSGWRALLGKHEETMFLGARQEAGCTISPSTCPGSYAQQW